MEALGVFSRARRQPHLGRIALVLALALSVLLPAGTCLAQQSQPTPPMSTADPSSGAVHPLSLSDLIREAEQNNPEIAVAERGYAAATHLARQASALPDPQIMFQQLSVGSPRPFAGYSNSDFAYISLGASQEIPFPGKRGLRGEVAEREADARRVQIDIARLTNIDKLKATYFQLSYLQQTLSVLERNDHFLKDVEQIVESRYRVGQGNQQEVLKAQLQHTRILQEITMHHRDVGQLEAQLKRMLNRPQESADIETGPLVQRPFTYDAPELLSLVKQKNSNVQEQQAVVRKKESQVELAKREFRPDFTVQYLYQNTDRKFRDYYMATLTLNLPNRGRHQAELAEAEANREQASKELEAEIQRRMAEVQDQYVVVQTSAEQLKIYKEGLIPQSNAALRASMASYQVNRQDFETLMSSFMDVLTLQLEYEREIAIHESALARLETLTGVSLP